MEHLKQIEDYPDYYVSNQGNVYSVKKNKFKKLHVYNVSGYFKTSLNSKQFYVHRLVAQAFIPNPENKPCVNHKDGNKQNNCVDNLEWATHKENSQYFQNVQKPNSSYEQTSQQLKEIIKRYRKRHKEEIKAYKKSYREKRKAQQKSYN